MVKLAELGSNKVFRMVMDNGSIVIARIPHPYGGIPPRAIASEVATMDFARTILGIPVPRVLAWEADPANPVRSEYILMEESSGRELSNVWDELDMDAKSDVVKQVVTIEKKLLSISFTRNGNLYFADDAFEGCEKVEIVGWLKDSHRSAAHTRFVIGPVTRTDFFERQRGTMKVDRGPWRTAQDYLKAIAQRKIAWLEKHSCRDPEGELAKREPNPFAFESKSDAQRTPEAHIALYKKFLAVVDVLLPDAPNLIRPTLWRWDLDFPNLFINSNNKVTALIDWQDVSIGPLYLQARYPRLVRYDGEILLEAPEHYKTLEDQEEKDRISTQVEKSLLVRLYEAHTDPELWGVFRVPHRQTRDCAVSFAANSWNYNFLLFRQCLIRIERHWDEIARPNAPPCPFHYTPEEVQQNIEYGAGYNTLADFWDMSYGILGRDGWVSHENYDTVLEGLAELKEDLLKGLEEDEKVEEDELRELKEAWSWAVKPGKAKGESSTAQDDSSPQA